VGVAGWGLNYRIPPGAAALRSFPAVFSAKLLALETWGRDLLDRTQENQDADASSSFAVGEKKFYQAMALTLPARTKAARGMKS